MRPAYKYMACFQETCHFISDLAFTYFSAVKSALKWICQQGGRCVLLCLPTMCMNLQQNSTASHIMDIPRLMNNFLQVKHVTGSCSPFRKVQEEGDYDNHQLCASSKQQLGLRTMIAGHNRRHRMEWDLTAQAFTQTGKLS